MSEPVVISERRGAVAIVTMNRPRYRNAQNIAMTRALDDAFGAAAASDDIKVIVLAGAGEHFSAGHDIGTPERDIHQDFPRAATQWWPHADKAGAEATFVREAEAYLGMRRHGDLHLLLEHVPSARSIRACAPSSSAPPVTSTTARPPS